VQYLVSIAIIGGDYQLQYNMIKPAPSRLTNLSLNELKFVHGLAEILDRSKFTNETVTKAAVALGDERRSRLWRASALRRQSTEAAMALSG
jgi:hypothetical protein